MMGLLLLSSRSLISTPPAPIHPLTYINTERYMRRQRNQEDQERHQGKKQRRRIPSDDEDEDADDGMHLDSDDDEDEDESQGHGGEYRCLIPSGLNLLRLLSTSRTRRHLLLLLPQNTSSFRRLCSLPTS